VASNHADENQRTEPRSSSARGGNSTLVYNPSGEKVGAVSHLRDLEYLYVIETSSAFSGAPADQPSAISYDRVMRINLRHPSEDKGFSVHLEGATCTNTTRKGSKESARSKSHETPEAARVAADKALQRKLKSGYVRPENFAHPGLFDPASPERIRWLLKAKNVRKVELLVNQLPLSCTPLLATHGRQFVDGPGGYGLLLEPEWHVVRHGQTRKVSPELGGADHRRFKLRLWRHPMDEARKTMLFVDGLTLCELDLEQATHRPLHTFEHEPNWRQIHYGPGEGRVVCLSRRGVELIDSGDSSVRTVLEAGPERAQSIAVLFGEQVAVRYKTKLEIYDADWQLRHAFEVPPGSALDTPLGTWLGGRMLVVGGFAGSVVFAVRPTGIRPALTTNLTILTAFDLRGAQWMTIESHDREWEEGFCQDYRSPSSKLRKRGPLRVLGVEEAWNDAERALQEAGPH
jgi:hypothetical protein